VTAAADLDGERLISAVRAAAWDLAHALANGDGDGREATGILSALGSGQGEAGLCALALVLADCADLRKISETCRGAHQAAVMRQAHLEETAYRREEYAHLRDGGVSPELAGPRVGVNCAPSVEAYEEHYQAAKRQREVA
jgi:hypothetical protein